MTIHKMAQTTSGTQNGVQKPFIDEALQSVEQVLYNVVDNEVDVLRDASRHILEAGGKRMRPRMVLLGYAAAGGSNIQEVVQPAAAIELVHTASVVHDDINDHGIVRRGRPSVNAIWGRTFALLTGDYLFTKVYELMAPFKDLNIILAEATVALVEGETLQASAVKENNLTREIYFKIIALKTAALFKAGAILGAKLAKAEDNIVEALGQYGFNIGLAFQIVDDILDIVGDEEQLGKTAGLDSQQGKGFTSVQNDPMQNIKQKFMENDRIDEARMQAHNLVEVAISSLEPLPDSLHKQSLVDLAHEVVNRDF